MNSNIVSLVNETLKDSDNSLEKYIDIINDPDIKKALDNAFGNKKKVYSSDLNYYATNPEVMKVIENYLFSEGINIVESKSYVNRKNTRDLDIEDQYFKDIAKFPVLSVEEEKELFTKLKKATTKDEKEEITNKIVNTNQRLVVRIAKRHMNRGLDFLDLVEEGNIGLISAVERFDINYGYRFSTYAHWWIEQRIMRSIADKGRLIRLPVHVHEKVCKMNRIMSQYYGTKGIEKDLNDEFKQALAKELNVSPRQLDRLLKIHTIISMDQPIVKNGDDKITIKDAIPAEGYNTEENYEEAKRVIEIRNIIENSPLTDREKDIIKMRRGIEEEKEFTLAEIGKKYEISSERVRQIQAKGETKLKKYIIKKGYML